jgi:hypothetical protein
MDAGDRGAKAGQVSQLGGSYRPGASISAERGNLGLTSLRGGFPDHPSL